MVKIGDFEFANCHCENDYHEIIEIEWNWNGRDYDDLLLKCGDCGNEFWKNN